MRWLQTLVQWLRVTTFPPMSVERHIWDEEAMQKRIVERQHPIHVPRSDAGTT